MKSFSKRSRILSTTMQRKTMSANPAVAPSTASQSISPLMKCTPSLPYLTMGLVNTRSSITCFSHRSTRDSTTPSCATPISTGFGKIHTGRRSGRHFCGINAQKYRHHHRERGQYNTRLSLCQGCRSKSADTRGRRPGDLSCK